MRVTRGIEELRAGLRAARAGGRSVGLVPTMGAFHAGHLALMDRARSECDIVVVSLFVNPTQFNQAADLETYPRDEQRDEALAREQGVDFFFVPPVEELYPPGFSTAVTVSGSTEPLEGRHRGRAHFDGVTTIVTKLLNIVTPDVAFFGQKDAQQAVVIRQLVRDLNLPVRIEVCPTVREADGLAMSSRNVRLSRSERERARSLHDALRAAQERVAAGDTTPASVLAAARRELASAGIEPEYLEVVSADTLEPVPSINGNALAVLAARVGTTRLIDNLPLTTSGTSHPDRSH